MKNLNSLLFNLLLFMVTTTAFADSYTITGQLRGLNNQMVYLLKQESGRYVTLDKQEAKNGKFVFKGEINMPEIYFIQIIQKDPIIFFAEAADIHIIGSLDNFDQIKVHGSKPQSDYEKLMDELLLFKEQEEALLLSYEQAVYNKDMETLEGIRDANDELEKEKLISILDFIRFNPDSYGASYIAGIAFSESKELELLTELISNFDAKLDSFPSVLAIKKHHQKLENLQIGHRAPDFTLRSNLGRYVSISDFQGKYTLLYFWASMYGPCRRTNAYMTRIYKKYKEKGLEVLGVSLDSDRKQWQQAIKKDKIKWNDVSDLKGWDSMAADLYLINTLPVVMVIDQEGKIVHQNLRGKELHRELAEIFNDEEVLNQLNIDSDKEGSEDNEIVEDKFNWFKRLMLQKQSKK